MSVNGIDYAAQRDALFVHADYVLEPRAALGVRTVEDRCMKKVVCVLSMVLALLGCKEDPPASNTTNGMAGTGAPLGGASGVGAGGAAGAVAGTGGMGAGGMGAAGAVPGCSAAMPGMPAALHTAAVEALAAMPPTSTCGGSTSCHQGAGKAMLSLLNMTDMRTALVGKMSCEAPMIPLVDGSMGDAALNNSWLWIKLTAPTDASGNLVSNPAWGTPGSCGQTPPSGYGLRMPWGFAGTMYLGEANMAKIRNWICAGAPGP
jgi:hypothetical protein